MRISDWSSDVCSSDLGRFSKKAVIASRASSDCSCAEKCTPSAAICAATSGFVCFISCLLKRSEVGGLAASLRAVASAVATTASSGQTALAIPLSTAAAASRSEELRGGKECVRTCKSRRRPKHQKTKQFQTIIEILQ